MGYQPLHHKYRPQRFDALIGQEAIAATLNQALISRKIAPAYLFSGPRGTGKTSSARILARSLNCLSNDGPTTKPCGDCELCKSIASGTALDIIEIDAASNTGVDNIRELIERARFAPVKARWKVYVIDECHMLSTAAFNALLKTLEEPPKQVVFILATTDPQRVLPTILSRCQRFDFRRIPLEALEKHLQLIAEKEKISIEPEILHMIAQHAQGGMRDAESLLDQLSLLPGPIKIDAVYELLGAIPEEELLNLVQALHDANPLNLLKSSRKLLDRGREANSVLQGLASILRDLVLINAAPEHPEMTSVSTKYQKRLIPLSKEIGIDRLLQWQFQLKGTETQLRQSAHPRLWLEILLLGLLNELSQNESPQINIEGTKEKIKSNQLPKAINEPPDKEKYNNSLRVKTELPHETNMLENNNTQEKSSAKNLNELWEQILGNLELPSTRMLLSQQAKLIKLTDEIALIAVANNWIGMIQSRVNLLEQAIISTLGSPRKLVLEKQNIKSFDTAQHDSKSFEVTQKDHSKTIKSNKTKNSPIQQSGKEEKQSLEIKKEVNTSIPKDDINSKTKRLADFFNGEILDLED